MGRILQHRFQWLLAIVCLLTSGTQAVSMTSECALGDARALMRIEARESMGATHETMDAMVTLIQARHLCQEGKVREALALYDGIASVVVMDERPARRPR